MINRTKIIEYAWLFFVVLLFVVSIWMVKNGSLASQISSFGVWAPIIFVLLKITTLVVAPLGGAPLYFIAGSLFGNLNGFILTLLSDVLGSAICFLLSRFYGERIVKMFTGEKFFAKIIKTVSILKDTKSFIKARVALAAMPEILAYASGLSKINFLTFLTLHSLFFIPVDFVLIFFGYQVVALIATHSFLFYFFVALVSIGGFWFLYKDYKKLENVEGM